MCKRKEIINIVNSMPDEGLNETLETIKEIYDFYANPPEPILPKPRIIKVKDLE